MKILFTTDTIQRGGKERQLFILASSLLKKGVDVSILTLRRDPQSYAEEYGFDPARILEVGITGLGGRYVRFKKAFRDLSPDIIFAWDVQTALFALLRYRRDGFAFVNGSVQHGIRLFKLSHLLRSAVCWFSPHVVANSLAGLRANNMRPGRRRHVLHNGIEERFRVRHSRDEVERRRGVMIRGYAERAGKVFISVGNLVPFKDYFTVLKALRGYAEHEAFFFLILGEGPMRNEIERSISEFGLAGKVTLVGRVDNVSDYLQMGDCLIHSSRGEGISNAILEAMYAGLPVIATDVGGIPETVFPGSSMLFSYRDDRALLHCLRRLPELNISFNPESDEYRRHLAEFSIERMVSRFEKILDATGAAKEC